MIRKHPSAPAYKRTKRLPQVAIGLEEYDTIHSLWEGGMKKVDIAKATGRCTGTIAYAIIHLTREDVADRESKRKNPHYTIERKQKDLSSLPADVLFEHSKDYFI